MNSYRNRPVCRIIMGSEQPGGHSGQCPFNKPADIAITKCCVVALPNLLSHGSV